jgi:type I restriction enzyme M protein
VNLYLHGFTDPHIFEYDTLTDTARWNEFADVILANPPFMSPKGGIRPHNRFSIQAKRSEVLFVDYIAEHLTPNGRAGIIVPEGIIFQSQNAYKDLRRMLVENSLVAVISLPAGCFNPYSGVKTSILLLDKSLARKSQTIAFFKVENDGYDLGAQRRPIQKNDLPAVRAELENYLSTISERKDPSDLALSAALIVPKEKIAANGDYNLSGERYREGEEKSLNFPSFQLAEVCDIFNGSTPSKQEARFWENGTVPWFTVDDIRKAGRIIEKTEKFVTETGLNQTSLKLLPKHTVLLCCTASVGEYAFTEIELTTNQQFNGLVVNSNFKDRLLPKYLFWIASRFKEELIRLSGKTSFNFVSVGTLKTIQIPLPPLEIQREIVAEIEGYQKVINGARAVLDNYRPHIPINPDWPMVAVEDLVSQEKNAMKAGPFGSALKKEFYVESGYKIYGQEQVIRGDAGYGDYYISEEKYRELESCKVKAGDVLISLVGTYGKTLIVPENHEPGIINPRLLKLTLDPAKISPAYFVTAFNQESVMSQVHGMSYGGTMDILSLKVLKNLKIALPPLAEQQTIVAEIEAEQALVDANRELITRFEAKIQTTLSRIWGE